MSFERGFTLTEPNESKDWTKLTDMASKHVSIMEAPEKVKAKEPFTVKDKVGEINGVEHSNTLGHWINWEKLYAGERLISRVEFAPEISNNYVVTLNVALNDTSKLRAGEFLDIRLP